MKTIFLLFLVLAFYSCHKSEPELNNGIHTRDGFTNLGEGKIRQYQFNDLVDDACIRLYSGGNQIIPSNMTPNAYYTSLINGGNPPGNSEVYTTEIE